MSQNEMMKVRREILTAVNKNKEREKKDQIYAEMLTNSLTSAAAIEHAKKTTDHMENILDIRFVFNHIFYYICTIFFSSLEKVPLLGKRFPFVFLTSNLEKNIQDQLHLFRFLIK